MGEESMSYFDMAENDYQYLKRDFDERRVGNLLCYSAQSICERYLKHIINEYVQNSFNTTDVLKTHSLTKLVNFIEDNAPDFSCDWNRILLADGYYFSARYPGADAIIVRKRDVENCALAVEITREAVMQYELKHNKDSKEMIPEENKVNDIVENYHVSEAIKEFDDEPIKTSVLDSLIAASENEQTPHKQVAESEEIEV